MNVAVKHMFRNRRQREGRRQPEPNYPAAQSMEWLEDIPPGWSYQEKEEHEQRQNLFIPPAYDYAAPQELPTSYQEAPDPLKFSDFYAHGDKIRPWAHVRVPAYLAIPDWESVADDEFQYGKLSSFGYHIVPQYIGQQLPIDFSPLIPEAEYATYGSLNELAEGEIHSTPEQDGYLYG